MPEEREGWGDAPPIDLVDLDVDLDRAPHPGLAPWEARIVDLNRALIRSGAYSAADFADALARIPPGESAVPASEYERWFRAVCLLLDQARAVHPWELAPDGSRA